MKTLLLGISEIFLPMFPSRTFNVLPLLILLPGTRRLLNLISLGAVTKHKFAEMEFRGHIEVLFLIV